MRIAAINWYGFETTTFVAHGLWIADYKAILDRIKSSGFNTVRIPYSDQMMSQNPVLGTLNINRNGINTDIAANATALDVLDKIIAYCGQIGLRVMLDNHRSNAGNSAQENGLWYTSEYPESTWLANWRALTTRYLGNTTVVAMDLRNEPHASACWGGDPAGCSAANDWHAAATRAGNAILAINPNLLIVVEGHDRYNNSFTWWGGMLRGVATRPVTLNVANRVVYSAHDYGPTEANQPWFNGSSTPASLNAIKDQNWGYIYNNNTAPMFVGEFGTLNGNADIQSTTPGSQGQWFSATVSYFQGKQWMGHAYWAMNGNDRYALFNDSFNGIVNQSKLTLLQTIQFPLDQQPGNVPAITSVSPVTVLPGSAVTINGSNFGTTQGTSTVRFGAIAVTTITSWSASQIAVTAPTNLPPGAYAVVVTVNGVASNAATINVPVVDNFPPAITSLSPTSGGAGQLVNVNGTLFGTTQGTSTVRFGTTVATVQLWANTNVLVSVPNLTPGTYPVTVTVGGRVSNTSNFLVTVHRLNSITPNTGNPGASVTLAGTGFGATQGTNTVRFGTTNVTVTSWSNTQIVATVPNVTGDTAVGVAVIVAGVASNEVNFLVTSPMPPAIATLSPASGAAGSVVTITGSNFGVFQNSSTVRFGTTNATISSWSNTQIVAAVPALGAGTRAGDGHGERQRQQCAQLHRDHGAAAELHVRVPGRPHGEPQRERRHHVHAHAHELHGLGVVLGVGTAHRRHRGAQSGLDHRQLDRGDVHGRRKRHAGHCQRDDLGRGHGPHHAHGAGRAHDRQRADGWRRHGRRRRGQQQSVVRGGAGAAQQHGHTHRAHGHVDRRAQSRVAGVERPVQHHRRIGDHAVGEYDRDAGHVLVDARRRSDAGRRHRPHVRRADESGRQSSSHHRRHLVGDLNQRGLEHDDQRNVLTISSELASGGSIQLPPVC